MPMHVSGNACAEPSNASAPSSHACSLTSRGRSKAVPSPCCTASAKRELEQDRAHRLAKWSTQDKGLPAQAHAWHAPEVECISKGKTRQPYEFGVKVGVASTFRGNLLVGALAFAGNPYDGHALNEQGSRPRS